MISSQRAWWGNYHMTGDAHLRTENEEPGLNIYYYLRSDKIPAPELIITDLTGKKLQTIKLKNGKGIHILNWNSADKKPGRFNFSLVSGKKKITKPGVLKPAILWPVKEIHK